MLQVLKTSSNRRDLAASIIIQGFDYDGLTTVGLPGFRYDLILVASSIAQRMGCDIKEMASTTAQGDDPMYLALTEMWLARKSAKEVLADLE